MFVQPVDRQLSHVFLCVFSASLFVVVLFLSFLCCLVVSTTTSTGAIDCLERLVCEMTIDQLFVQWDVKLSAHSHVI